MLSRRVKVLRARRKLRAGQFQFREKRRSPAQLRRERFDRA